MLPRVGKRNLSKIQEKIFVSINLDLKIWKRVEIQQLEKLRKFGKYWENRRYLQYIDNFLLKFPQNQGYIGLKSYNMGLPTFVDLKNEIYQEHQCKQKKEMMVSIDRGDSRKEAKLRSSRNGRNVKLDKMDDILYPSQFLFRFYLFVLFQSPYLRLDNQTS